MWARALTIADRWCAMQEVRPYRSGLDAVTSCEILDRQAKQGKIDAGLWFSVRAPLFNSLSEAKGQTAEPSKAMRSAFDLMGEMGHNEGES